MASKLAINTLDSGNVMVVYFELLASSIVICCLKFGTTCFDMSVASTSAKVQVIAVALFGGVASTQSTSTWLANGTRLNDMRQDYWANSTRSVYDHSHQLP